jgi:hypothetical protein
MNEKDSDKNDRFGKARGTINPGSKKDMQDGGQPGQNRKKETRTSGDLPSSVFGQSKKILAEHTIGEGETLSQIALNYYGHATREYWMVIYNANKVVIGDDPGMVKPGMKLKIPELPANMK